MYIYIMLCIWIYCTQDAVYSNLISTDAYRSRVPGRSVSSSSDRGGTPGKPGEFALQWNVGGRVVAPVAEAVWSLGRLCQRRPFERWEDTDLQPGKWLGNGWAARKESFLWSPAAKGTTQHYVVDGFHIWLCGWEVAFLIDDNLVLPFQGPSM